MRHSRSKRPIEVPWRKMAGWMLALVAGLFIIWGIAIGPRLIRTPEWGGDEPFRLAMVPDKMTDSGEVWIVSYYPQTDRVLAVTMPAALTVETAGNYGKYRIASLPALGRQEKQGTEIIRKTLSRVLGMPIRAVVVTGGLTDRSAGEIKRGVFGLVTAAGRGRIISLNDALRLWWAVSGVEAAGVTFVDLNKPAYTTSWRDVDGSDLRLLNVPAADAAIDEAQEGMILDQNTVTVTIENATDHGGLGQMSQRILGREGLDVVALTDGPTHLPYTLILLGSRELLEGKTGRELKWLYPEAEFRVENVDAYRSEVVIRLGERGSGWWE